jgi:hypothetical protein
MLPKEIEKESRHPRKSYLDLVLDELILKEALEENF